jgi:plasmid stabilization system protein ParE
MPARTGTRDHATARLTAHALQRFRERFVPQSPTSAAESALRQALACCRRLGRNPRTGAVAVLALHADRVLVAIFQGSTCLTVMTWPQFEPHLPDFGRNRLPRKRGRMLRRLRDAAANPSLDPQSLTDEGQSPP